MPLRAYTSPRSIAIQLLSCKELAHRLAILPSTELRASMLADSREELVASLPIARLVEAWPAIDHNAKERKTISAERKRVLPRRSIDFILASPAIVDSSLICADARTLSAYARDVSE